jgi:hypothetical protein
MNSTNRLKLIYALTACSVGGLAQTAVAFEGRITAAVKQNNETNLLLFAVSANSIRLELAPNSTESRASFPNPVDIVDPQSGALTLLFPHNRSFVRLKPSAENPSRSGVPPMQPPAPGLSLPPVIPAMPPMIQPTEKRELKATGETTNLFGMACSRYEIKERGQTLEIWATDQLFPYQRYVRSQSRHFGARGLDEQWPELLKRRQLFPLLAILKFEKGPERFRFEVKAVTPAKLTEAEAKEFEPPPGYHEIQPLPF